MILPASVLVGLVMGIVFGAPTDPDCGPGEIWAVLVAGSNGFENYRHQADICHAYQILHRHGVPDSHIIVMMYDDIANNEDNPRKGVIINKPNGTNVYGPKKVPKDYTGEHVTPENFIHVLTGNQKAVKGEGSGKVLKSGPNDHVFVNFVDHGAPGLIGFPDGALYAHDLIKTLKTMKKKKMFKKLVFYLESCESGSMFANILPKDINIFATTAANATESSYGCYCNTDIPTCLGDEYSVSWMEDVDAEDKKNIFKTETLLKQYKNVVKRVAESHPKMFGEKSLEFDHLKDYMGTVKKQLPKESVAVETMGSFQDSVPSREVALYSLERRIEQATSVEEKGSLQKKRDLLIKGRADVDELFLRILAHVTKLNIPDFQKLEKLRQPITLDMLPCYKTLVDSFSRDCVNVNKNSYTLAHLYKLANLCATKYASTDDILQAFAVECSEQHRTLRGVN